MSTRSTRGRTWEEIYGPEVAAAKRAKVTELGRRVRTDAERAKLSASQRRRFAEGAIHPLLGKTRTPEERAKIAATRRERYGSRASVNRRLRNTAKYKEWRTAIFERDDWECQGCGASTRSARARVRLEAHHIRALWELLDGLTFEEALVAPAVWDADNAITLCEDCHGIIPVGQYWKEPEPCASMS